jgi:YD repeat-containing protein
VVWVTSTLVLSDQASFFYDALGRLVAVVDSQGNTAIYTYDKVGNLLSITRGTVTAPVIAGTNPDAVEAGVSTPVTISGSGLQFTTSVTSSHPEIQIHTQIPSDTSILTTIVLPNPTVFGPTTITVNALGGTASVGLTVRQPTPTITRLLPNIGIPGMVMVIEGTGFGTKPGSNLVTFAGPGGVRVPATVLSEAFTSLRVQVPLDARGGPVSVEVGGLVSSGVSFAIPELTGIVATATQGVPANPVVASANVGQVIQLLGAGFHSNTRVIFPITTGAGVPGTVAAVPFNVSPDGTSARVNVPFSVTSGPVTIEDTVLGRGIGSAFLQIVPTLNSLTLPPGETLRPGLVVTLAGSGFKPGATTVSFPGAPAPVNATSVSAANTTLTVTVPPGVTPGPLTVSTDGGTSQALILTAITVITATATQGLPTNPAVASAHTGQQIQLQGAGFSVGAFIHFSSTDDFGAATIAGALPSTVSPDGTTASVSVPFGATTGVVKLPGSSFSGVPLQIVPTVNSFELPEGTSLAPGLVATLGGSGFKEGATGVFFPGVSSPVAATDVFSVGFGGQNNRFTVSVPDGITIPAPGGVNPLTIVTDGGTSNQLPLAHPQLTALVASAARGTPANPAQPSANINQLITLNGSAFRTSTGLTHSGFETATEFLFPSFSTEDGSPTSIRLPSFDVSADGRSANLNVPFGAISGPIGVHDPFTRVGTGAIGLQIVPVVENINGFLGEGAQLSIRGHGFAPGATQVLFPGVADPVSPDASTIISSGGTEILVTVPPGVDPAGQLTVRTNGGVSNPFALATLGQDEIEPNDDPSIATPLAIESSKRGGFQNSEDVDYYRFTVGGATELRVTIEGLGFNMQVRVSWIDQDGTTVLETVEADIGAEQGRGFSIFPQVAGDYFLRLVETSGQQGPDFTYQIRLFTSD